MGVYQCTNNCMLRVKDNDLIKEDIIKTRTVTFLQSYYRGFACRKKFKKNIAKYIKYKKKKYLSNENQILFKEYWIYKFPIN